MRIIEKLKTILDNPIIDSIANTLKKFKSSKSYYSVSYLVLLFTFREAIAWKWGSRIKEFTTIQVEDSAYPYVWDALGFIFDGGSIELVALGMSIFLILSLVKVSESENAKVSLKAYVIIIGLMVVLMILNRLYTPSTSEKEKIEIKKDNYFFDELNRKNSLIDEEKEKRIQAEKKYAILLKMATPQQRQDAEKIFREQGIYWAIAFLEKLGVEEQKEALSTINTMQESTNNNEPVESKQKNMEAVDEALNKEEQKVSLQNNGTVIIEGLVYENRSFTHRYTWEEAKAHCTQKGNGWRLPSVAELHQLSNIELYGLFDENWQSWFDENKDKRLQNSKGDYHFIREEFIENMPQSSLFWTSKERDSSFAWCVTFSNGYDLWSKQSYTLYVLCVRGQ